MSTNRRTNGGLNPGQNTVVRWVRQFLRSWLPRRDPRQASARRVGGVRAGLTLEPLSRDEREADALERLEADISAIRDREGRWLDQGPRPRW